MKEFNVEGLWYEPLELGGLARNIGGGSISPPASAGFDLRSNHQFCGAKLSSQCGLMLFRDQDDFLGLTEMVSSNLRHIWTVRDARHYILAMSGQSLIGAVAGHRDARQLARYPARGPPIARKQSSILTLISLAFGQFRSNCGLERSGFTQ